MSQLPPRSLTSSEEDHLLDHLELYRLHNLLDLLGFSASGDLSTNGVIQAGQKLGVFLGGTLSVLARNAGEVALVLRGRPTSSTNLIEAQVGDGTVVFRVHADGELEASMLSANGLLKRTLLLGPADSAGVGYRTVRVAN